MHHRSPLRSGHAFVVGHRPGHHVGGSTAAAPSSCCVDWRARLLLSSCPLGHRRAATARLGRAPHRALTTHRRGPSRRAFARSRALPAITSLALGHRRPPPVTAPVRPAAVVPPSCATAGTGYRTRRRRSPAPHSGAGEDKTDDPACHAVDQEQPKRQQDDPGHQPEGPIQPSHIPMKHLRRLASPMHPPCRTNGRAQRIHPANARPPTRQTHRTLGEPWPLSRIDLRVG